MARRRPERRSDTPPAATAQALGRAAGGTRQNRRPERPQPAPSSPARCTSRRARQPPRRRWLAPRQRDRRALHSVSAACSTAMKGPHSPPLVLMTPTMPAATSTPKLRDMPNTQPARTLSAEPAISVRRLPYASALVDMASVTAKSPSRMQVSSAPVSSSDRPTSRQNRKKTVAIAPSERARASGCRSAQHAVRVTHMRTRASSAQRSRGGRRAAGRRAAHAAHAARQRRRQAAPPPPPAWRCHNVAGSAQRGV